MTDLAGAIVSARLTVKRGVEKRICPNAARVPVLSSKGPPARTNDDSVRLR